MYANLNSTLEGTYIAKKIHDAGSKYIIVIFERSKNDDAVTPAIRRVSL